MIGAAFVAAGAAAPGLNAGTFAPTIQAPD
jgi:hypothetical protein